MMVNDTLRLMRETALEQRKHTLETDECYQRSRDSFLSLWTQFASDHPDLKGEVWELLNMQANLDDLESECDFYTALQMGLQMRETDQLKTRG